MTVINNNNNNSYVMITLIIMRTKLFLGRAMLCPLCHFKNEIDCK